MNLQEAKNLQYGEHIIHIETNRRFKVNGKPKTWKRNLERVLIPVKYGLYVYGYFDETEIEQLVKE